MRPLTRLTLVMVCLAAICVSVRHAAAQDKNAGRLELQTTPVVFDSRTNTAPLRVTGEQLGKHCCPDPKCCDLGYITEIRNIVRNVRDLGVLIVPQRGSTISPEEISIEIYEGETKKLLFSTRAKCGGCGEGLSLTSKNKSTGYLLTLDKKAAKAAEDFFKDGNTIRVRFKTRGDEGALKLVYLVNAKSFSR